MSPNDPNIDPNIDPNSGPNIEPSIDGEASHVAPADAPAPAVATAAPLPRGETAWETLRSLLVVLVGVLCFRTFIAEATVIPTGSMEKTIMVGDHLFLNKLLYGPQLPYTSFRIPSMRAVRRQEIVAFHYPRNPATMYVKRVIGVGGDVVRMVNKKVSVNGAALVEPYVQHLPGSMPLGDNFPPPIAQIETFPAWLGLDPGWAREMPNYIKDDGLHVPQGYLFVMGDNRDNSADSRFWGFVPEEYVVGEPLFVFWSYDAPTRDWMDEGLKGRLQFDASILWNFIKKTRWSRTGKFF
ncbi:MAG TPA: signal peptidase I [Candidatus Acidoferrum sp.]|nr:signal peptidase I [Candidatus Acidoferrum sp.]